MPSNIAVEAARAELAAEADSELLERAKRIEAQSRAAADANKRDERAARDYGTKRDLYAEALQRKVEVAEKMIAACQVAEEAEKACRAALREAMDACDGAIPVMPEAFSQMTTRNNDAGYAARQLKKSWDRRVRL